MKVMESVTTDKKGVPRIRFLLNVTRYEALLIQDALSEFRNNRSEASAWDSQNDPIIVAQMNKAMKSVN